MSLRTQFRSLNPYDIHKLIINEYLLNKPGDTRLLRRNGSKDRTDFDVIRENHKFLWDNKQPDSWEQQFAKKYYDKLFKEYCIGDLSLFKENKIALRWRIEKEVLIGKGQFICGNKRCNEELDLRTWEVNFTYKENGNKKNALVKIRLCLDCSAKLNYDSKKREIKRLKRKPVDTYNITKNMTEGTDHPLEVNNLSTMNTSVKNVRESDACQSSASTTKVSDLPWVSHGYVEAKSREDEMDEYLQDLLL